MNFFDSLNPSEIPSNIKELIHCPFCASDYQEKNIKILAQLEGNYVIHLSCTDCKNSIMASFSLKKNTNKSFYGDYIKKTDAKIEEMIHFVEKGNISNDDVMNFYKEIKHLTFSAVSWETK